MDLKLWISKYHGMELGPDASDGRRGNENGILFLAYYLCLKQINGRLSSEDVKLFAEICENLRSYDKNGNRIVGLFDRGAGESLWSDKNSIRTISHDNLTAISCFSKISGLSYHKEIYVFGSENLWIFDNVYPENPRWSRAQHPRDIILWSHLSGKTMGSTLLIISMLSCIVSCASYKDKKTGRIETSGKLLSFLRLYSIRETLIGKITWKICNLLINRNFKDGWISIFNLYFNHLDHPILLEAKEACDKNKNIF